MSKKFLALLGLCAPLCLTTAVALPNLVLIALSAIFGINGAVALNNVIGGSFAGGGLISLILDGGVAFFGGFPHTTDLVTMFGPTVGAIVAL